MKKKYFLDTNRLIHNLQNIKLTIYNHTKIILEIVYNYI